MIDNAHMSKKKHLNVGIVDLTPVRVVHKLCIFPTTRNRPDKQIRKTFQNLREYVVLYGLDPDTLLHIGIPTIEDQEIVTYECCLEFPLPIENENEKFGQKTLPGGQYVVLRVEKKPQEIGNGIRQLYGDYIPDNQIVIDEMRPVYEIYYEDTMEYCVPVFD